ncbi:MAG: hypothetical protein DRP57_12580 [Spirochaetes bacterium]|nr:MAG: hypothetical protein DRP57_12580 [Spirochaetota bacterium]
MIFRTVKKLSILKPDILVIKTNPARKILYSALGFGLAVAFFIGLSTSHRISIYFYITLVGLFFSAAAFSQSFIINRKSGELSKRISFFSINIIERKLLQFKPDTVALNLIGIPLFDNYPMDKTASLRKKDSVKKNGSLGSLFKRRFVLYRLFIDNPDTRIKLFETTIYDDAQKLSENIGKFLEVKIFQSSL